MLRDNWIDLESIRPKPLYVDFDYTYIPGGKISLGIIPADFFIKTTVVQIIEDFDNNAEITIGDDIAQGRLMASNDSNSGLIADFIVDNNYQYGTQTELNVYFPSGTPTKGSGRAIVYPM